MAMPMPVWERQSSKGPSFSSSLLDAIYRSTDETREHHQPQDMRRNNAAQVEEDIQSLRRAIMIEKWMENHTSSGASRSTPHHFSSNSASSTTDSSSDETTDSSPKSSLIQHQQKPKILSGRFTKTKSKAQKIYGELKKVKEPISPGGKISNFLNSIFSPRNLKANHGVVADWSSMRKSRSMKDTSTTTCSMGASRSCLSKNASSKSKRSVRFCPVSVIVDEDCQPCGHKSMYNHDCPPVVIKKNMDSIRVFEGRKYEVRDCYQSEQDLDGVSCASSDLFELENIGRVDYEQELPVYETTSLQMNHSIAGGLVVK